MPKSRDEKQSGQAEAASPSARGRARAVAIIAVSLSIAALLALAGSQGSARLGGVPLLVLVVAAVFVVQWAAFVPSWLLQSDRFFDATGSATYICASALALAVAPRLDATALLLGAVVMIWALRLGSFLLARAIRTGGDGRFEAILPSWPRLLGVWTLQGLWITVTAGAAWAAVTTPDRLATGPVLVIGLALWLLGFGIEVVADAQKRRFRADPANAGEFITTGLWSLSRHPNYLGEILLWIGVALMALPALHGWQLTTLVSPVFVTLLLLRVSGVPLVEARADARWGGRGDYEEYKARTPVLIPRGARVRHGAES